MQDINTNIQKLTNLIKQSKNKKLLWEEMQIISEKAFDLQDKIMAELDKMEALEKDIVKVQAAFTARETIWELMNQLTERELELKSKTFHKETPEEKEKRHHDLTEEECHCCCGHHDEKCCHQKKERKCCRGKKCKKN